MKIKDTKDPGQAIRKLVSGLRLSQRESRNVFRRILTGALPPPASRALLLLLAARGESLEEVLGCLRAIADLEPPADSGFRDLMDNCGTGGDGRHTFNISTAAALVIAGAGGRVSKHGNRAITSRCGSSDLLEAAGVNLSAGKNVVLRCIRHCGIGYFHAPRHHPIFMKIQPLRRSIRERTVFNLLGPLLNPLRLRDQLVGISSVDMIPSYLRLLEKLRRKSACVCRSHDGLDEISASAKTDLGILRGGKSRFVTLDPRSLGFRKAGKDAYQGGSAKQNLAALCRILGGKSGGPLFDVVLLNAGVGLWVNGKAADLETGLALAEGSLREGRAADCLKQLVALSRSR